MTTRAILDDKTKVINGGELVGAGHAAGALRQAYERRYPANLPQILYAKTCNSITSPLWTQPLTSTSGVYAGDDANGRPWVVVAHDDYHPFREPERLETPDAALSYDRITPEEFHELWTADNTYDITAVLAGVALAAENGQRPVNRWRQDPLFVACCGSTARTAGPRSRRDRPHVRQEHSAP